MTTYEALREEAINTLKNDDDLFVDMITELDNWNGYADGFRAYPMYELDDLFCDCKVSEFLSKITDTFSLQDEYMVDTIYGLDSTNDIVDLYRINVWEADLLDSLIDNIDNVYFTDDQSGFKALLEAIIEANQEA